MSQPSSDRPAEPDHANPNGNTAPFDTDLAAMRELSDRLIAVATVGVHRWVLDVVAERISGLDATRAAAVLDAARGAADEAATDVHARLAELLAVPVDEQSTTPLAILRGAHRYPTAVLSEAGAIPVQRDPFEERVNPDDLFGVAPGSWADFGEEVLDAGMAWGAAKAFLHKRARRQAP
ncbi:MAG: hypothetical protein R2689_08560 [Microthrixaceae bacterium]|nr:hypothetical protein [Microthrixaceae bacterium]